MRGLITLLLPYLFILMLCPLLARRHKIISKIHMYIDIALTAFWSLQAGGLSEKLQPGSWHTALLWLSRMSVYAEAVGGGLVGYDLCLLLSFSCLNFRYVFPCLPKKVCFCNLVQCHSFLLTGQYVVVMVLLFSFFRIDAGRRLSIDECH